MRRRALLASLLVALLVLAGCGQGGESPAEPGPATDPVELVGLWRVDAPGEDADTWLRLDAGNLSLWRGGGMMDGSWTADGRTILALASGYSGTSPSEVETMSAPWLLGAHRYRAADEGWEVLDDDGDVLATLSVDGAPEPIDTAAGWYAEPPEVTDETRAALAPPEPLPAGLVAADAEDLLGRWVPAGESLPTDPHVVVDDDGTWQGSDGCNGVGGRWAVGDDGRLLTVEGPMTLIGCEGAAVGSWMGSAAHAGLDGDELVLVDAHGEELGRLSRG